MAAPDNDRITSQLDKWKKNADDERRPKLLKPKGLMVGTGRFELPQARLCLAPSQTFPGAHSLRYYARSWGARGRQAVASSN